jgi:hypothetical protein
MLHGMGKNNYFNPVSKDEEVDADKEKDAEEDIAESEPKEKPSLFSKNGVDITIHLRGKK